jgi:hypothetical protein
MAASTESLSPSRPAWRAPVGRAAPHSSFCDAMSPQSGTGNMQGAHGQFDKHRQGQCRTQEKVPCRQGRGREARALGVRCHGSVYRKFKPVTASVACAGRACPCCQVALSTSPTSPAPPPRSIVHMESCAHGTHCLTGTTRTIRSLLQPARTKPGRPGKSAMSAGPLQRSARPWSPRSWQHRPKV